MAQNLRLVRSRGIPRRSRAGPVPIALRRSGSSNSGSLASGWSWMVALCCPTYVPLKLSASAPILTKNPPNFGGWATSQPGKLIFSAKWIEMADVQWNDRCDIPPLPSLAINAERFEGDFSALRCVKDLYCSWDEAPNFRMFQLQGEMLWTVILS